MTLIKKVCANVVSQFFLIIGVNKILLTHRSVQLVDLRGVGVTETLFYP